MAHGHIVCAQLSVILEHVWRKELIARGVVWMRGQAVNDATAEICAGAAPTVWAVLLAPTAHPKAQLRIRQELSIGGGGVWQFCFDVVDYPLSTILIGYPKPQHMGTALECQCRRMCVLSGQALFEVFNLKVEIRFPLYGVEG